MFKKKTNFYMIIRFFSIFICKDISGWINFKYFKSLVRALIKNYLLFSIIINQQDKNNNFFQISSSFIQLLTFCKLIF